MSQYIDQVTINQVKEAVRQASARWKKAFNTQNAKACADCYQGQAIMEVKQIGTFKGREEIQSFWQKVIDDGFLEVEYINPEIEVLDEKSAILSSEWKMNKASGVIYKELWKLQENGGC